VLLDEKRTKRLARIMAVFTAVAFLGGGVVLVLVSVFGGSSSSTSQLVSAAQAQVKSQPTSALAWDGLANAYQASNNVPAAIAAAQHAQKLDPADQTSAFTLVNLYTQTGQSAQALSVLETYTAKNPTDPTGLLQLGQSADQSGLGALAYSSYMKYLSLTPTGATSSAVRAHLPIVAKIRDAQARTTANPKDAAAWHALAAAFQTEQNAAGSITAAVQAAALAPTNIQYMVHLATIYKETSQPPQAVLAAARYTKRNPKNPPGYFYLGTYAQQAGQKAVARAAFTTYLRLAPNGSHAKSVQASLTKLGTGT
jgi:cytochrome c-type biogenesis protein CcmH/NrfG